MPIMHAHFCASDQCWRRFEPKHPQQIYCCATCRNYMGTSRYRNRHRERFRAQRRAHYAAQQAAKKGRTT